MWCFGAGWKVKWHCGMPKEPSFEYSVGFSLQQAICRFSQILTSCLWVKNWTTESGGVYPVWRFFEEVSQRNKILLNCRTYAWHYKSEKLRQGNLCTIKNLENLDTWFCDTYTSYTTLILLICPRKSVSIIPSTYRTMVEKRLVLKKLNFGLQSEVEPEVIFLK